MAEREQFDQQVADMRKWIDDNRDRYQLVRQKLEDPKFVENLFRQVYIWLEDLMSYDPTKGGDHVAAFIIGRTQVRVHPFLADVEFKEQYEEELARFNESVRELEKQRMGRDAESDVSSNDAAI